MIPVYGKKLKFRQIIPMWLVCYLGNFVGISLLCFLFIKSGSNHDLISEYIRNTIDAKLAFDAMQLLVKAILCNFIVCVGAYVGMKMEDDTAKTIIMMIVVMAFVLPGFEHSIANMGYFSLGATLFGTTYNWIMLPLHMLVSTFGNIIGGGVLLGLPLFMMIKPKK